MSTKGNVTSKAQRLALAAKDAIPTWKQFMGTVKYSDAQTGAQRSIRCDYFDLAKSKGWRQGDPVVGLRGTGDADQRQKPKAAKADMRRAKARLDDRGY